MQNSGPRWFTTMKNFLTPHKTIPRTIWTADERWQLTPLRFGVLIFGLTIFGLGDAFLIQSSIGNSPWTVLSQGISLHSSFSIGASTFLISGVILALWWPLGERPGFGTIANMIVIAIAIQLGISLIPEVHANFALSLLFVFLGIFLVGAGSSLYITTGLGPGPRDGVMTALHHKTGIRVARVRLCIELCALTVGVLLGGKIGIGTACFALFIGHSVAINLAIVKNVANAN